MTCENTQNQFCKCPNLDVKCPDEACFYHIAADALDDLPYFFAVFSVPDYRCTYMNKAVFATARKIGIEEPGEMLGKHPWDVLHDLREPLQAVFGEARRTGEVQRQTGMQYEYAGRVFSWDATYVPYRDTGTGEITAILSLYINTTDRKQAEEEMKRAYEREHYVSHTLQRALAPTQPFVDENYPSASVYAPAYEGEEVGGDFFDVFRTENGRVGILVGDVSGKGVEAAALGSVTKSTIRAMAYTTSSVSQALSQANCVLKAQDDGDTFVTVFLAVLEPNTGLITLSSAGHPPAVIYHADGSVEWLKAKGLPLAIISNAEYAESEIHLEDGDKLLIYTDGISESRKGKDLFGWKGIESILLKHGRKSPRHILSELLIAADEWSGGHAKDDRAAIIIERCITDNSGNQTYTTNRTDY